MEYKAASKKELEEFCDKNTCRTCIMRKALPQCGAGEWIGNEPRDMREWAAMLIDLDERTRKEEGGEKIGDN